MATGALASVPDCEHIGGTIMERNVGEFAHANLQSAIAPGDRLSAMQERVTELRTENPAIFVPLADLFEA